MESTISKKVFTIEFNALERWSVSFFRSVNWRWPKEYIHPIGDAISRNHEVIHVKSEDAPIIEKISFDGELSLLAKEKRNDYKGKLFIAKPGQLIYSKIRVKQGSVCIIPHEYSWVAVSAEYPVYDIKKDVADPDFLDLVIRSIAFQHYLDGLSHGGSTKTRIHPDLFEALYIPIPPLHVQKSIVEYWKAAQQELLSAEQLKIKLIEELNTLLFELTHGFREIIESKVFIAIYSNIQQWDVKAGRAAAFITANPSFIRLGDYTEECIETVRPWEEPDKEWPIYGVNNKGGVFLSTQQKGHDFNAPYKKIEKDWFFHNPTRANVGSLGIVPPVPSDAITSPEYQVWRITDGFLPGFMALMLQTKYFIALVEFNRVGGVKQRMYYANMAEIRIPMIDKNVQWLFADRHEEIIDRVKLANKHLCQREDEIEEMILGIRRVERNEK